MLSSFWNSPFRRICSKGFDQNQSFCFFCEDAFKKESILLKGSLCWSKRPLLSAAQVPYWLWLLGEFCVLLRGSTQKDLIYLKESFWSFWILLILLILLKGSFQKSPSFQKNQSFEKCHSFQKDQFEMILLTGPLKRAKDPFTVLLKQLLWSFWKALFEMSSKGHF